MQLEQLRSSQEGYEKYSAIICKIQMFPGGAFPFYFSRPWFSITHSFKGGGEVVRRTVLSNYSIYFLSAVATNQLNPVIMSKKGDRRSKI